MYKATGLKFGTVHFYKTQFYKITFKKENAQIFGKN
jgi:hypothetical protein